MRFLKLILDFYLNSSMHVALSAFAFVRITEFYFGLPFNQNLDYFVFFSTITGYNFVKYAGVAKLHHRSLTKSLKIIQIFSFICFFAMCFFAYKVSLKTLMFCIPFEFLTFLYAIPFFSGFHRNLRDVSYLKIIVVALVWAGITVLVPVVDAGLGLSLNIGLLFLQRFLIVIVLILPFDIRDVKYDAISLQTIPKKIGVQHTKRLGLSLLVFSMLIEFMITPTVQTKNSFMLFFFLILIFLMRSKINQSKYYSSFFVEALPIFWWLLLLGIYNF
ncbi:hypothetical protein MC378_12840 [Polaribacter sp. MSW13]|uniref:Prenyltransferase n=1 Tax=Polaribacter marinus TaxID=2916838 RepID=A0A9X1VPY5_9FLAO|nr:hypothetical protein [Polaribacter marinus]MCI2230058.1 hypothetical protein [Polaribacter marinus]